MDIENWILSQVNLENIQIVKVANLHVNLTKIDSHTGNQRYRFADKLAKEAANTAIMCK